MIADLGTVSPAELVTARCRAFARGDFALIYDSYHPASNFCRQFPDRAAYLAYARTTLAADFDIVECRVLKERGDKNEARVLFFLATLFRGERHESFELARLLRTAEGWRYHSGQKLGRDEFSGALEAIDWTDFERVRDKVVF